MAPKAGRTYGKKKSVIASRTTAIFTVTSPVRLKHQDPSESPIAQHDKSIMNLAESPADSRIRNQNVDSSPSDLVEALTALDLNTTIPETSEHESVKSPIAPEPNAPAHLQALLSLAQTDNLPITLEAWTSILPPQSSLTKIAEASFAEVYRITTSTATSIVKIMPLKHASDIASLDRTFASSIDDVIPELRIMNTLTEIPGFVTFKGARIVTGNQSEQFVEAWEKWGLRDGYIPEEGWEWDSEFEHPSNYGSEATFLAIELGDAGEVLEDVIVDRKEKVWDIWLGSVVALARAEALNEFEHRDLHENNICVYEHPKPGRTHNDEDLLFDRSGLEITIIDYGLSRAKLQDGHITFKDLESDLELFRGKKWHRQFETYRQMRSHLYTNTLEQLPLNWHKNNKSTQQLIEAGKSWEDYIPLSNIFWLSYLLDYLILQYTTHGPAKKKSANRKEIMDMFSELGDWLDFDPKTKVDDTCERFTSAGECLDFCVEVGWIGEEQLGGGDMSFVSLGGVRGEKDDNVDEEGQKNDEERTTNGQNEQRGGYTSADIPQQTPTTPQKARLSHSNPQHTFFSPFVKQEPVQAQPTPGSTRQLRPRTPSPTKASSVKLPKADGKPGKSGKAKISKSKIVKVEAQEAVEKEKAVLLPTRSLRSRKESVDP